MNFDISFQENEETFDTLLNENLSADASFGSIQFVTEKDHSKLFNRDADNQHPIKAITELTETLESLETESITSAEIDEILNVARR